MEERKNEYLCLIVKKQWHFQKVWQRMTMIITREQDLQLHHEYFSWESESEQQGHLHFCTQYFYRILYTNVKYGQKVQPLYWLKSQILVEWKGLFQQNFANTNSKPSTICWLNSRRSCKSFSELLKREIVFIYIVYSYSRHTFLIKVVLDNLKVCLRIVQCSNN